MTLLLSIDQGEENIVLRLVPAEPVRHCNERCYAGGIVVCSIVDFAIHNTEMVIVRGDHEHPAVSGILPLDEPQKIHALDRLVAVGLRRWQDRERVFVGIADFRQAQRFKPLPQKSPRCFIARRADQTPLQRIIRQEFREMQQLTRVDIVRLRECYRLLWRILGRVQIPDQC